jgi:hypothetical protein
MRNYSVVNAHVWDVPVPRRTQLQARRATPTSTVEDSRNTPS